MNASRALWASLKEKTRRVVELFQLNEQRIAVAGAIRFVHFRLVDDQVGFGFIHGVVDVVFCCHDSGIAHLKRYVDVFRPNFFLISACLVANPGGFETAVIPAVLGFVEEVEQKFRRHIPGEWTPVDYVPGHSDRAYRGAFVGHTEMEVPVISSARVAIRIGNGVGEVGQGQVDGVIAGPDDLAVFEIGHRPEVCKFGNQLIVIRTDHLLSQRGCLLVVSQGKLNAGHEGFCCRFGGSAILRGRARQVGYGNVQVFDDLLVNFGARSAVGGGFCRSSRRRGEVHVAPLLG